ncbi:transient receptor potential cation channel subfamily M member 5-like isoform X1 [Asterias amurensis]|uniref:transient receptor potential cation channel subfamily M member 5-like isoform X1 n=2 Tax=Asterias amurensis TaxID=7602 RepID=UPI003AB4686A
MEKCSDPVQSSQVKVNIDSSSYEMVSTSPNLSKKIKNRIRSKIPRGSKTTTESVELQDMGFSRQTSGYDLGFSKNYMSGSIQFMSDGADLRYKRRKYMVVHPDENPDTIVHAMAKKWNVLLPKLLLCLVGGDTTTASLPMQRAFSKVLVEALLRTDGWLFTGGLNCGMIQCVGQALTKYVIGRAMLSHQDVVAVGVAPLDVLSQDKKLLGSERDPVEYNMMSYEEDSGRKCLEPNHTHFILVKDKDKESVDEAKIRDKLVSMIASRKIKGSKATVPALYLVFGGGVAAIETVHDVVIKSKLPVLIVPSSGGAADVLTEAIEASRLSDDTEFENGITYNLRLNAIMRSKMNMEENNHIRTKDQINKIIKRKHLISIYDKDRIEEEMLKALMKASRGSKVEDELLLAAIWNRMERAKELVLQAPWKNHDLFSVVYYSLVNNQSKFVKLCIDETQFDLKEFLSQSRLVKLYNEVSTSSVLHKLLSKERAKRKGCRFTLGDVANVLKRLIFDTYESSYPADKEDEVKMNSSGIDDDGSTFKDPMKELFVWAVLQQRCSMAKLFWKRGKPSIGGALFASKVLKEMSSMVTLNPQASSEMHKNAKEFQIMAIDILSLCFAEDRRRTSTLLVRKMPDWGHVTCLNLAGAGRNKEFIAQDGVQNLLSEIWMGRLSRSTGLFKIWFCMCVPFSCLCLVTFMSKDDPSVPVKTMMKRKAQQNDDYEDLPKMKVKQGSVDGYMSVGACDETDGKERNRHTNHQGGCLPYIYNCLYNMKLFYEAPVISFRFSLVAHFLFLGLFSYILLANFHEKISIPEMVLIFWAFTLFTEELSELLNQEYCTLYNCFKSWLFGYWNSVDLVSLLMFAIGIGLRFHPVTMDAARIVLALDLIVFYLRILHICSASKLLGPKLIMIIRMMVDLSIFICILLVFMVSYGVACQSILFPNTEDPLTIAKGVFFRTYFQLYGELFLDEMDRAEMNCVDNKEEIVDGMELCPRHSWFGTIVLAMYLFISNILLLNLLIAMLNNTFTRVHEKTDIFWRFQRYQLVEEYYRQPFVIPPFIIVVHVYQVIRWAWSKCCPCRKELYRSDNLMKKDLRLEEEIEISTWEVIKGEDYLAQKKEKTNEDLVKRLKMTEEKLGSLSYSMKNYFEGKRLGKALEARFSSLEEQIYDSMERRNKNQGGDTTVDGGGGSSCLQVNSSPLVRKLSGRKSKKASNNY